MLEVQYQIAKSALLFSVVFTGVYLIGINKDFSADLFFLFGPVGLLILIGSLFLAASFIFLAQTPARLFRAAAFWAALAGVLILESTASWFLFYVLIGISLVLAAVSLIIPQRQSS